MAKTPVQLDPATMADLSGLFYELAHDKETRKDIAKLVKKKFPDRAASFTDIDNQEAIEALEAKHLEREQLAEGRRIQAELNKQRQDLIDSGRYDEKSVGEIEKIIERHGHAINYETASILYSHENPPANPQDGPPDDQRIGATWEFPTVNGKDGKAIPFAEFAKDPNSAAHNAAYSVITEFKKRSGIRAGAR
jgi:hypothetical protein